MPYTGYLNRKIQNEIFGATAFSAPATLYFALGTSATAPDGTGAAGTTGFTEVSGGSYARVSKTNDATNFGTADSGTGASSTRQNKTAVTFPAATASWGVVRYAGIFDASTGGNMLAFAQLTADKTIDSGDTASFAIDAFSITAQP